MAIPTESVKIETPAVSAARKKIKKTKQTLGGFISTAIKEKIDKSKPIKTLRDIDYSESSAAKLLITALAILTTSNYADKTPDEIIGILNDKSTFIN